jgi:hypothetical protein
MWCMKRRGAPTLLFIDLHLVHEVTSPQAFQGLRERGIKVRRPDLTIATADHGIPTTDRSLPIVDAIAARQLAQLETNCAEFGNPLPGDSQQLARHCARDRAGTGPDATGDDGGVRRQPHCHPRSLRRSGVWHWDQRSGARARDAVPVAAEIQELSGAGGRRAEDGRFGQGHYPGADCAHRRRRRHGLRVRIHRQRHSLPDHGRAHDGVQHVD